MKIATWNLQRLERGKIQVLLDTLADLNADIFVLTETGSVIEPGNYNCISTDVLPAGFDGISYKPGESRVSILTKYRVINRHKTFDAFTSICADVESPFGLLTVYGSILGVLGNRQPRFDTDLQGHLLDCNRIFPGRHVCLAGDLNVTFSGRPCASNKARQTLGDAFRAHYMTNTTAGIEETVDHIVLSNDYIAGRVREVGTWNECKMLSDHPGHILTLT